MRSTSITKNTEQRFINNAAFIKVGLGRVCITLNVLSKIDCEKYMPRNKRIRNFVNMDEGVHHATKNNNKVLIKTGYFQYK